MGRGRGDWPVLEPSRQSQWQNGAVVYVCTAPVLDTPTQILPLPVRLLTFVLLPTRDTAPTFCLGRLICPACSGHFLDRDECPG